MPGELPHVSSVQDLLKKLETSEETGLSDEAVSERLKTYGYNGSPYLMLCKSSSKWCLMLFFLKFRTS